MNAVKALELLSPIPQDKFISHIYTNCMNKCCTVGHLNRLTSNKPDNYGINAINTSKAMMEFRDKTLKYLKEQKGFTNNSDIADISNMATDAYPQDTQKDRAIALLNDMIADGWVD